MNVQCYHLPNCAATFLAFLLCFITVSLATVPTDSMGSPRIL